MRSESSASDTMMMPDWVHKEQWYHVGEIGVQNGRNIEIEDVRMREYQAYGTLLWTGGIWHVIT